MLHYDAVTPRTQSIPLLGMISTRSSLLIQLVLGSWVAAEERQRRHLR